MDMSAEREIRIGYLSHLVSSVVMGLGRGELREWSMSTILKGWSSSSRREEKRRSGGGE